MPHDLDDDLAQMTRAQTTATIILQRMAAWSAATVLVLVLIDFNPDNTMHWICAAITMLCIGAAYRAYKWHTKHPRDTSCDNDPDRAHW